MQTGPVRRCARRMAAMAGAALLALTACSGPEAETGPGEAPPEETELAQDDEDPEETGEDVDDSEAPGTDEGSADGSEASRSMVFIPAVDADHLDSRDGETRVSADHLADLLEGMGGAGEEPAPDADPAACEDELRFVPGADVRCTVTANFDGSSEEMTFFAHPIAAPGNEVGVVFTADDPLTEDARWATFNGDNEVVMLGRGSMYGSEPIPQEQLVTDVQTTLDFDYDDIDLSGGNLTARSCEDGLDFERLAPVQCTAIDDENGEERRVWVLPATPFGRDRGLIVSVETEKV